MSKNKEPRALSRYTLKIRTWQYDSRTASLFSMLDDGEPTESDGEEESLSNDGDEGVIELTTEADVSYADGRLSIMYDETELTGLEGSRTSVSFTTADPGLISIIRTGAVRTAVIIELGKRHICTYETPLMPFEVCTFARKIENSLTPWGGKLSADYTVEIRGALAQRTILEMELTAHG